ncbi:unnamed protein product [Trichobilharzia szidati]|nr:unnamed protein product [Trichobilharzia szidati]
MNLIIFSLFIFINLVMSYVNKVDGEEIQPSDLHTEIVNDSMNIGINDIMKVIETLNSLSSKEYTSIDYHDDEVVDEERNAEVLRYPRAVTPSPSPTELDSEYKNIPCSFKCILRPKINSRESKKVYSTALHLPDKNTAILDCFNSSLSINQTIEQNQLLNIKWNKSVTSQCVTHFTSRLLHIVIGTLSNETNGNLFTFTSSRMSTAIYNYILTHIKPITDLYITIALPLFRLDRSDFNRLSPWLRYISLDGKMLRHLDVMLVANLSLDYFIIQDCIRKEETMINPHESSLPDSRIELNRNRNNNNNNNNNIRNIENECLVYWRYSCPHYPEFILVADLKAHERRCPANTKRFQAIVLERSLDSEEYLQQESMMTTQPVTSSLRAKRSPKRTKTKGSQSSTLATTQASSLSTTTEDKTITPSPTTTSTTTTESSTPTPVMPSSSQPPLVSQLTSISLHNQTSTESCASMDKFLGVLEDYLDKHTTNSNNDCEEKLDWLRNMITVLVAILLLMTMILLAALIMLSYSIRQYMILQRENKIR